MEAKHTQDELHIDQSGVVGELVEAVRRASLWVGQYKELPAHKPAAERMLRVLEAALAKAKGGK